MSRNRLSNSKNMFQGSALKVLCVCSAGLLRSPTMARLLSRNYNDVNPRAVGVSDEYALIPLDQVHLFWSDIIICADTDHYDYVVDALSAYKYERPVFNLKLPDEFAFGDERLESIMLEKFKDIEELCELKGEDDD